MMSLQVLSGRLNYYVNLEYGPHHSGTRVMGGYTVHEF